MSARRFFASVRIAGDALDPLEVTRALRLPPDHGHRKGEPRLRRGRRDGLVRDYGDYEQGLWAMSSRRWVDSAELDAHVRWLLDQLEPRAGELQRLLESGNSGGIFCYGSSEREEASPLSAVTLGRCVALSLPVERGQPVHEAVDDDDERDPIS